VRKAKGLPLHENAEEPDAQPPLPQRSVLPPPAPPLLPFVPLPAPTLLAGLLLALLATTAALLPSAPRFGDHVHVTADRRAARTAADDWLSTRGVDPTAFRSYVRFQNNLDGNETDYLWQQTGTNGLRRIFPRRFPDRPLWMVRYFRPGEEEGYAIYVDVQGKVRFHYHALSETAPGATLPTEEAREIAAHYLETVWDVDLDRHNMVYSNSSEREARTDHTFIWEDQGGRVGAATYRHSISVVGNEPMGGAPYLEVPEAWLRARGELRLRDLASAGLMLVTGGVIAMLLMRLAYRLITGHLLHVRCAAIVGLFAPAAAVASRLDSLTLFWARYDTATDPDLYLMRQGMAWFVAEPLAAYVSAVFLIAFADATFRYVFPLHCTLARCFALDGSTMPARRRLWGEALLIACGLSLAAFGAECVFRSIPIEELHEAAQADAQESAPAAVFSAGNAGWAPWLGILAQRMQGVQLGFAILFTASVIYRYLWTWKRLLLLFTPFATTAALMETGSPLEIANTFVGALALILLGTVCVYFVARWILRDNLPALLATSLMLTLPREIGKLATAQYSSAQLGAAVLAAVFATLGIAGLWLRFGTAPPPPDRPTPDIEP
jgi:hypothetical protein